jgi:tRNA A-37 threonylcarbamoyl transferase component Bud32
MQCPQCKQTMEPGVRFCPNDGTPLTDTAAVPTVATAPNLYAASRTIELPIIVGGRYRLERLLGGGGMAKVYRGVDLTLEREVAVKLINPELRADPEFDARFQREAKIASQLSDPHIIVVHDFGIDPTHGPFLVMELLQGCSLRERLQKEGPLPLKAGLQLSAQLMLALLHAHEKGIVHRDIKPDNIFLLNQSGVRLHVRVLDFGIARIYKRDEPAQGETLTAAGAVLGTPRYMSPEQLAGQPVDARSDLYSAALVIHEAVTGQLPYTSGKKLTELCPEASNVLQDLLDQCLKPSPDDRPPSAVEVYLRLQELGKASGILLLPTGAMDRLVAARHAQQTGNPAAPPTQRRAVPLPVKFLAGMAALIVLLGVLTLGKYLFFSSSPPPTAGPETLLGVKVGDPQQQVVDKLGLTKGGPMNPWRKEPPAYLGHILQKEDLPLSAEELDDLDVQRTSNDRACVLFYKDKVIAVVVHKGYKDKGHAPARTGGGVALGGTANDLANQYGLDGDRRSVHTPYSKETKEHAAVLRYNDRGVAFLIEGPEITSIALYPRRDAP